MTTPAIAALIVAGGVGVRARTEIPKQYQMLTPGVSVLRQSIEPFLQIESIERIFVTVAEKYAQLACEQLADVLEERVSVLTGCVGDTRCETVSASLARINELKLVPAWVLVHDAARPLTLVEDINSLISDITSTAETKYSGGTLISDIPHALYHRGQALDDLEVCNRQEYAVTATPQMYDFHQLQLALAHCLGQGMHPVDETQAMLELGHQPMQVSMKGQNFKITSATDLQWARAYLRQQEAQV